MLIVNADDWGGWLQATDAALACHQKGRISSVSAMVFMADSDRAAALAKENGLSVGLHLNFTQELTGSFAAYKQLVKYHSSILRFLRSSKYALLLYNPLLGKQFRYVVEAQLEEFVRLYGKAPDHFDGHQHMHLCTNMLIDPLIPEGARVRRSFSFLPGEKSLLNRSYRNLVDRSLARRYRLTNYFFSLSQQLQWNRFDRVLNLASTADVELMVHPEWPGEFGLLTQGDRPFELTHAEVSSAGCA